MKITYGVVFFCLLAFFSGNARPAEETATCPAMVAAEVNQAVSSIICKRDNCPSLNQPDSTGHTPEEVYYYHCSSDAIELRTTMRNATIDAVLFQVNSTRYPTPPEQITPTECLNLLEESYPGCEVEIPENKIPEPDSEKSQSPGKVDSMGGCAMVHSVVTKHSAQDLWFVVFVLAFCLRRIIHRELLKTK